MRIAPFLAALSVAQFAACTQQGGNGKGDAAAPKITIAGNPGPNGQSEPARVVSEEEGVVVAQIGASLVDQRIAANGAGAGAAALFPPNALPAGTLVTVEVATAITRPESLAELGFDATQAVTAAGPALAVTTADHTPAAVPFTLVLALPDGAALVERDLANLAILYHARVGAEFDFRFGVLPRSALKVKDGVVFFSTQLFGVYQAVLLTKPVESAAEKHVATAFETKTQAKAVRPEAFEIATGGREISWHAAANAISYRVAAASDAGCTQIVLSDVVGAAALVWTLSASLPDGDYFACVVAVGAAQTTTNASNNGLAFTLTTTVEPEPPAPSPTPLPPSPPAAFSLNPIPQPLSTRPLRLTWSASAGADHYVVSLVDTGTACSGPGTALGEPTVPEIPLPAGAGLGKAVCVKAVNAGGETAATNDHLALRNGWTYGTDVSNALWNYEATWTGSKFFAFGGCHAAVPDCESASMTNEAHLYDPVTETWTTASLSGAPTAREGHGVVGLPNGKAMVFGGYGLGGTVLSSGGIYDSVSDSWTPTTSTNAPSARTRFQLAVNASGLVFFFGGNDFSGQLSNEGAVYDVANDAWTLLLGLPNQPAARAYAATLAISDDRFFVWGGAAGSGSTAHGDGAIYDPATGAWTPISNSGAPSARRANVAHSTGSKIIIWGGCDPLVNFCDDVLEDGFVYDVATDQWSPMNGAVLGRQDGLSVWTGTHMLVWAGKNSGGNADLDVALYDPVLNAWSTIGPEGESPTPVGGAPAIWTGKAVLVVGGATAIGDPPAYTTTVKTQLFYP